MHENLPLGKSPPVSSNSKSSFLTQEVDICDGEVKLVRTKQSNQIWQVRIWVRGEGRYFRKSLRTRDLEQAKEKAKSIYYKMMGQVEIGKKIFSISAEELVDGYTKHQQQRVDGGFITAGRFTTIKTQLKHFLGFVGENTKLDSIQSHKYKDYYAYRKKKKPEVKNVTLVNERATLGHMYKWGLEQGFVS